MEFGGLVPHTAEIVDAIDGELLRVGRRPTHGAARGSGFVAGDEEREMTIEGTGPCTSPASEAAVRASAVNAPEFSVIAIAVVAFSLMYLICSGVENGVGPAALTTMQAELNATTTAVTAAQSMSEVTKLLGSLVYGYVGGSMHKPLYIIVGCFVWAGGAVGVSFARHVAALGVGYFLIGAGYASLIVLDPAVLNAVVPDPREKHRVPFYLGITYTFSSVGVALGFVLAGLAVARWRLYFALSPLLLLPVIGMLLLMHNKYLQWRASAEEDAEKGGETASTPLIAAETAPMLAVTSASSTSGLHKGAMSTSSSPTASTAAGAGTGGGRGGGGPHSPSSSVSSPRRIEGVRGFVDAIKGADVTRPSARQAVSLLLANKPALFTIIAQTFQSFYTAAFITLLPKFIEEGLGASKGTASYVLAGTIPAVCVGIFLGGWLCKRLAWSPRSQLLFCFCTNLATLPLMFMFLITSLPPFIAIVIGGMLAVFLPSSPSISLLAVLAHMQHTVLRAQTVHDGGSGGAPLADSVLVATIQGLGTFLNRLAGTIPGPIILGVLIDYGPPHIPFYAAYLLVGLCGTVGACASAFAAWRCGIAFDAEFKAASLKIAE